MKTNACKRISTDREAVKQKTAYEMLRSDWSSDVCSSDLDQEGTRNPYKCMTVIKQDVMDDKIIERCKTCEKQCMQEGLDRSKSYRVAIKLAEGT